VSGLEASHIAVGYGGKPVIHDLTLPPLARGSITALIGPNAAGKSTLLRGLAGLEPMQGTLHLDGADLAAASRRERAKRIAYMPQALPPAIALTVLEAVVGALRAAAANGDAAHAQDHLRRAYDVLDNIGIADLAMRSLTELSGGQRQLASLAQAIVRAPEVLLLDEPTSALDLRYQMRVMDCAKALARERNMIVVAVLHDIGLAARYADQVAVLNAGRLVGFGSPSEAITSDMLAEIYGVRARVGTCELGTLHIIVDGASFQQGL
jgi:iron complex transport system ATP-binding protein